MKRASRQEREEDSQKADTPSLDDIRARAEKYIRGVRAALERLEGQAIGSSSQATITTLLNNVKAYIDDAEYYINKGDPVTALVSISYAEGLMDSLGFLGLAKVDWPRQVLEDKRVVVAGTFDILHPGHVELFRFASKLGKLYVIVARDANAQRDKGRPTILDEQARLQLVSSIKYVYEAILGDVNDYLKPLEEIKPDYVVLGPDQAMDEEWLATELEKRTGKRPVVIRFSGKREFSGGLRGSSDIIKKACKVFGAVKVS